jgi:hypothetical protein
MTLFGAAGLLLGKKIKLILKVFWTVPESIYARFVGFGVLGIPAQGLGHNLSSFFVYIWARMFEGALFCIRCHVVILKSYHKFKLCIIKVLRWI